MNEMLRERWELVTQRIREIPGESQVNPVYKEYFDRTAAFLYQVYQIAEEDQPGQNMDRYLLDRRCRALYQDILPDQYETSYANPVYAVALFGEEMGRLLSLLYAQLRGSIAFAYEKRYWDLTILAELFVEVYTVFSDREAPVKVAEIREILYWYFHDYCEEIVGERTREQVDPSCDFAKKIIMESDLGDPAYLYRYGEYITDNEIRTAEYLNRLDQQEIDAMARIFTEGYRMGFVHAGIDLSKKLTVDIRYPIGFERMIRAAILQFEAMGLKPTIFRYALHAVSKRRNIRCGYVGTPANPQYEYDHRMDDALFLDEDYVTRKLRATRSGFERVKELARRHAGPAVVETFGEETFTPVNHKECWTYTKRQQELMTRCSSEAGQITNRYIPGDERGFTVIAYPLPSIGEQYEAIFRATMEVNQLDSEHYGAMQQKMIDALNEAEYVTVKGSGNNQTDMTVMLYPLTDPEHQAIFENCVADMNIPVGEVFTSPVLKGTHGVLHVSRVYLNELPYENLRLEFLDGRITSASCTNFEKEEDNQNYIRENILFHHKTLPIGEFAIGTNTTAYRMGRGFGIEDQLPILIAEKTGPHFAVGDTCYCWAEDVPVYNPDGKEIVARDNEVSLLRKTDPAAAYLNCHTDITIPYDELESITLHRKDGSTCDILRDGFFVLPGTEELNLPLQDILHKK